MQPNRSSSPHVSQHAKPETGFGLPACPYCGKRLNPLVSWLYKTKGEYRCPACGSFSTVTASPKAVGFGIGAVAAGLCLLILFLFLLERISLFTLLLVPIPFFIFTLLSPFFVRLQRMDRPPAKTPPARPAQSRPGAPGRPASSRQPPARRPPAPPPGRSTRPQNPPRPGSAPRANPRLFDTAEFSRRAPRDFSNYRDK